MLINFILIRLWAIIGIIRRQQIVKLTYQVKQELDIS